MKGKKIAVILGASKDGDAAGNGVVGDADHSGLADRANGRGGDGRSVFCGDGIKVLGGVLGNEVGDQGRNEMTTAVKTFVNQGLLVVGGDYFLFSKWLAALRANHSSYSLTGYNPLNKSHLCLQTLRVKYVFMSATCLMR